MQKMNNSVRLHAAPLVPILLEKSGFNFTTKEMRIYPGAERKQAQTSRLPKHTRQAFYLYVSKGFTFTLCASPLHIQVCTQKKGASSNTSLALYFAFGHSYCIYLCIYLCRSMQDRMRLLPLTTEGARVIFTYLCVCVCV